MSPEAVSTWKLDPLVGVADGPHVHHHVHPTGGEVLVIRGPGQTHHLRMVTVELVLLLKHTHLTLTH